MLVGNCWPVARSHTRSGCISMVHETRGLQRIWDPFRMAQGTGSPQCLPVSSSSAELSWVQPGDFLAMSPICSPSSSQLQMVSCVHHSSVPWMCAKASKAAGSFPPVPLPGSVGSCPSSKQMFSVVFSLPRSYYLISVCIAKAFHLINQLIKWLNCFVSFRNITP